MTPAERASAVAFALKNCALDSMTPSDATMRVAARYEYGDIDVSRLLDDADDDRSSAVFVRTIVLAERR